MRPQLNTSMLGVTANHKLCFIWSNERFYNAVMCCVPNKTFEPLKRHDCGHVHDIYHYHDVNIIQTGQYLKLENLVGKWRDVQST